MVTAHITKNPLGDFFDDCSTVRAVQERLIDFVHVKQVRSDYRVCIHLKVSVGYIIEGLSKAYSQNGDN